MLDDRDFPWIGAAYRRGVFAHLPEFPPDMAPADFKAVFLAVIGERIFKPGGEAWIFEAQTRRGVIPVGLVIAVPNRGHAEPHVFWFPEASARNRLECAVKWLHEMKERWKIDIWARERDWQFYNHLCHYGLIRTIGKYRDCFEDGGDAIIYQSVKKNGGGDLTI